VGCLQFTVVPGDFKPQGHQVTVSVLYYASPCSMGTNFNLYLNNKTFLDYDFVGNDVIQIRAPGWETDNSRHQHFDASFFCD
jgi:hypothetical protein